MPCRSQSSFWPRLAPGEAALGDVAPEVSALVGQKAREIVNRKVVWRSVGGRNRGLAAAAAVLIGLSLAACGGGSPEARCFEFAQGTSRVVVKVESAPNAVEAEGGQITVYSYLDGVEEFAPETTVGRLEADAFVYGDGTRLAIDEDSLTWPTDSLLEGAVFTATSCP